MTSEKTTHFYGCQLTTSRSVKQHKLRKLIAWLSDKRASEKEFVSLYLQGGRHVEEIVASLKKESASASDKSENTRRYLGETFKEIIHRLKRQEVIPENGLAMFAGYLSVNTSENRILDVEEIIPPEPIDAYLCVVDDHFQLEPLRDLLRDQRVVGLLAVDSKNASLGLVRAGSLKVLDCATSGIAGKTGKGGQSQRRYERERDMELNSFFHRVAEHATREFLVNSQVTALIVGGPGQTKADFLKGVYLNYELQNAVLKVVDTQSADEKALREMQSKSSTVLANICGPEEKEVIERLFLELNSHRGLAVYGLNQVLLGLKEGTVEVALVIDTSDLAEYYAICKKCGNTKTQILNRMDTQAIRFMSLSPCNKCHAFEYEVMEKDMVDVLEDAGSQTNARVEVIFTDSEEKARLKALGGFAAILRYKPSTSEAAIS